MNMSLQNISGKKILRGETVRAFGARCLILGTILLLSGCGGLLPEGASAPRVFTLEATTPPPPRLKRTHTLQVHIPQAVPALDSDRMVLKRDSFEIDHYKGAVWAAPLPQLVQARLVDGIERAQLFKAVAGDTVPFTPDFRLFADITDFQAEYKKGTRAPDVHIRMVIRLTRGVEQQVVATDTVDVTVAADNNTLAAVAAAANKSFDRALFRVTALLDETLKPKPKTKTKAPQKK